MFGGIAQLIAGMIQFRIGNAFTGVLFSYLRRVLAVPVRDRRVLPEGHHGAPATATAALQGQALGLFLFAFGVFTVWILIASFRTNVVVVLALAGLAATLFVLGAGQYYGKGLTIESGGYMGLVVAALAAYIGLSELCEASYKRWCSPSSPWPSADRARTTTA